MSIPVCVQNLLSVRLAAVLWATQAAMCSAQVLANPDPAGLMMQEHIKRMERAAPDASPKPVPKPSAPQAPVASSDARVLISEIQFSKSELLAAADLQALGQRFVGRQLSTADIQQLLDEVSRLYQDKGILTGVPVLPQQDLRTGLMRILLVEGRLGEVQITTPGLAHAPWVQRWFDLAPNEVLSQEALRERLVRFNNVSDFSAKAEMTAGEQFGQTNLRVNVTGSDPLQAWGFYETSSADQATAPRQMGAGLRLMPISSRGGRLDLSVLSTDVGSTLTGAMGWPLGVSAWRTSLSGSAARSDNVFTSSDGKTLKIQGQSSSLSWDVGRTWVLRDPWVLVSAVNVSTQRSKTLAADVPLFDRESNKIAGVLTLTQDTPRQRGWWRSSFNVGSDGNTYRYWEMMGNWRSALDEQGLWLFRTSGLLRIQPDGVLSTLDRFYLGGADTVRGFDAGSAAGDHGAAAQLELRRNMSDLSWASTELYAFLDLGQAQDSASQGTSRLRSAGFGIQTKLHDLLGLELMASQQLSTHRSSPTRAMMRLVLSY